MLDRLTAALSDRYRIERELGEGGMATVYLAEDLKHHRMVAIKVLRPELAAALGSERFLREIETTASLRHPHILPLYDSGEGDGLLYYVMPLVEGESLRDRLIREKQLPLEDALQIASEVADALGYAHSRGVIHRDIKPENILLESGHAMVADFGIAKAISAAGGEKLTRTGMAIGTPEYMSPEQASADAVDGRSDLYALGAVLYEMLAGDPPYTGATAQAITAKRLMEPVPRISVVRETVPPHLEQALTRVLAKAPADRYRSAEEFIRGLKGTSTPDAAPAGTRSAARAGPGVPWRIPAAVLALLAIVFLVWRVVHRPATTSLDANLVAVAPFDILDPQLALWHEGLVDYLSKNLDGAGPLRSVPSSMAIREWPGHGDQESARDLGRRTGAKLVVFGQLVGAGADSVRLRATLLDASTGSTVAEFDRAEVVDHIDRLADSITVDVLRGLGQTPAGRFARLSSVGTSSFSALKAYLQGEQYFRRASWDSAILYFGRAIELDTNFALALRRQFNAVGWQDAASNTDLLARAVARNHGLAARDSLLLAADSFGIAFDDDRDPQGWSHRQRQLETLREVTRRYPTDAEAWYQLGEAQFHVHYTEYTLAQHLQPFARAVELDSTFAPAYIHAIQLSLYLNDTVQVRRYLGSYLALSPSGGEGVGAPLVAKLLDARDSTEILALLFHARPTELFSAWTFFAWFDPAELRLQVARRFASGVPGVEGFLADKAGWKVQVADELIHRGHLGQALGTKGLHQFELQSLGLFGALGADSVSRALSAWLGADLARASDGLQWWIVQRDTTALSRFIRGADSAAGNAPTPGAARRARSWAAYGRAALALAGRDSAGALRQLTAIPDSLSLCCVDLKLVQARLLAAAGRDSEAVSLLVLSSEDILAQVELGRVAERLGEIAEARQAYQNILDAWRRADPELQPYIVEARAGLQRLSRRQ